MEGTPPAHGRYPRSPTPPPAQVDPPTPPLPRAHGPCPTPCAPEKEKDAAKEELEVKQEVKQEDDEDATQVPYPGAPSGISPTQPFYPTSHMEENAGIPAPEVSLTIPGVFKEEAAPAAPKDTIDVLDSQTMSDSQVAQAVRLIEQVHDGAEIPVDGGKADPELASPPRKQAKT